MLHLILESGMDLQVKIITVCEGKKKKTATLLKKKGIIESRRGRGRKKKTINCGGGGEAERVMVGGVGMVLVGI